ncbi:MAG: hypothetical protein ABWZ75_06125, partial [Novosphingobium sp.]
VCRKIRHTLAQPGGQTRIGTGEKVVGGTIAIGIAIQHRIIAGFLAARSDGRTAVLPAPINIRAAA